MHWLVRRGFLEEGGPEVLGQCEEEHGGGKHKVHLGTESQLFSEPKPRVEGTGGGLSLYPRWGEAEREENQPCHMTPL